MLIRQPCLPSHTEPRNFLTTPWPRINHESINLLEPDFFVDTLSRNRRNNKTARSYPIRFIQSDLQKLLA